MPREKRLSARQPKHKDFSDSDEDFSDSETMVRSPPKKPKKNNTGLKYTVDDLSDDNNAILTPVIRTSDATTMPPAHPIMQQTVPSIPPDVPLQSYPCGTCRKEVSDDDAAIFCESGCSQWYHRICAGLTENAYNLLTNEENADWVCDQCISKKNIPLVKLKS